MTLTTAPSNAPDRVPAPPIPAAVSLRDVRKSYGAVHAVDGISLDVGHGEFFGVLGPNGAGKTTLLEIVEGLRQADSGTVDVLGVSPWPRNRALLPRLGVQTQSAAFFPRLTAREHLATVAALYGVAADRVAPALERFGLAEKADEQVDALSGGQQQRLAIAAAVIHEPELIFLDEPTAALDPRARRDLWSLLSDLRREGRTIVYTTHHLDEAETLCDRVVIVDDGRVIAQGTPRELVLRHSGAPVQILVPADALPADRARQLPGVVEVRTDGPRTVIATADAGAVFPEVAAIVGADNVQTRSVSLEDVYLSLTGKEYHS